MDHYSILEKDPALRQRSWTLNNLPRRMKAGAARICMALPAFESFAASSQAKVPMRLVRICIGPGMPPGSFFPKPYGRGYELSPLLAPARAAQGIAR